MLAYKGKAILYKPGPGRQEVQAPRISRQSAHEGGKVVSPTHRPPLASHRYFFMLEFGRNFGGLLAGIFYG
jgi:hypothetical protein